MQNSVDYLNLEYLLVRLIDLFSGVQGVTLHAPDIVISTITGIFILGMFLSLVLLIMLVYAQIQLLKVEHAGFHAKEAHHAEHAVTHDPEVVSTGVDERWERIATLAASGNQGDWRRAILEADIMMGDALAEAGYTGSGVGEQLKLANPIQLTTLDLAWKAHKVRNEVAHGGEGYELSERDKSVAIDYYKRVLEELGSI